MKQIVLAVITALALCQTLVAKTRTVTELDSLGHTRRVIELADTTINGVVQSDTLSITTYLEETDEAGHGMKWTAGSHGNQVNHYELQMLSAVCAFLLPVVVVFLYFYFRHKDRKARYRLMEQAIAQGQPLPEELLNQNRKQIEPSTYLTKGVRNICLGIGLFIFLWALTDEFGLACIGLMLMFTGFGQVIIHYLSQKDDTSGNYPTSSHSNASEE